MGMNAADVLVYFERLGAEAGVGVYIADRDANTGYRGFGIGMQGTQKGFLRDPRPVLVLGLESCETLVKRGFGPFLDLPCVRYLELPFTRDQFDEAAKSLRGATVDAAVLGGVRRSVTVDSLESIRINVTHRLNGVTRIALDHAVEAANRSLTEGTGHTEGLEVALAPSIKSLASSDATVREALSFLDRTIDLLDGICTPEVSKVLRDQRKRLGDAARDLARFVIGIAVAARVESPVESLAELAAIGAAVSQRFEQAGTTISRLSNPRGGA